MKYEEIMEGLLAFKEEAQKRGFNVYAIALKGSQNYNLDDEDSDIDANIVYLPTLAQIRQPESLKITLPIGECTLHSIYEFVNILSKGNPQFIELVHTEYILGDLSIFKDFKLNPSALKGMMLEKVKAFSHLYPSRAKYVEKFGYDPKQLHHIIRLYDALVADAPFIRYSGGARECMLDIKRGRFPGSLEEAIKLRDTYIEKVNDIYETKKLQYVQQKIDYKVIDKIVLDNLRSI